MLVVITLLVLGCYTVHAADTQYSRHVLFDLKPEFPWQLTAIAELKNNSDIMLWSLPAKVLRPVQVMVAPNYKARLEALLKEKEIKYSVNIHNVQSAIRNLTLKDYVKTRKMTWDAYYDLDSIYYWFQDLKAQYPTINITTIAQTVEGRPIQVLHIPKDEVYKTYNRQAIFLEGGLNPRDWISTATANFMIYSITQGRSVKTREYLRRFDWYILPIANPDGYVHTFTEDRLWNKNRGNPHGVVLSRNWDFMWLAYGGETDVKSDIFAGMSSFSEPETKGLSQYLQTIRQELGLYISLQSYGQMITIPYGYTDKHLDNYDVAYAIARAAIKKIIFFHGTEYIVGNPPEILSHMSGTSQDWIKHNLKIPLVYTYYLRDNGRSGFLLPSDQIAPNCEEMSAGIVETLVMGEKFNVINYENRGERGQRFAKLLMFACVLVLILV